jgi:predicted Fe-Mo cluster-binding NifX family protein
VSKVLVTSQGKNLDDNLDPRFGRAAYFLVVDPESMEFEVLDNQAARGMAQGAGIQAAEQASKSGAETVLSGFVGPKAFMALQAAGLRICQKLEGLTVRQAVEKFKTGDVEYADGPNKQGHWS